MNLNYIHIHTYTYANTGANTNGYLRWTVNNISHIGPTSTPLLLASYYGLLYGAHSLYNATVALQPIRVSLGEVVDMVIQNRVALNGKCETHPWHMHGNEFLLLGQVSALIMLCVVCVNGILYMCA